LLHIDMQITDPWVLPIWNAIHEAVRKGRTTHPGDSASQLSLHLSTRLAMLPVIFRRTDKGIGISVRPGPVGRRGLVVAILP
jgi:hypothetical protein